MCKIILSFFLVLFLSYGKSQTKKKNPYILYGFSVLFGHFGQRTFPIARPHEPVSPHGHALHLAIGQPGTVNHPLNIILIVNLNVAMLAVPERRKTRLDPLVNCLGRDAFLCGQFLWRILAQVGLCKPRKRLVGNNAIKRPFHALGIRGFRWRNKRTIGIIRTVFEHLRLVITLRNQLDAKCQFFRNLAFCLGHGGNGQLLHLFARKPKLYGLVRDLDVFTQPHPERFHASATSLAIGDFHFFCSHIFSLIALVSIPISSRNLLVAFISCFLKKASCSENVSLKSS